MMRRTSYLCLVKRLVKTAAAAAPPVTASAASATRQPPLPAPNVTHNLSTAPPLSGGPIFKGTVPPPSPAIRKAPSTENAAPASAATTQQHAHQAVSPSPTLNSAATISASEPSAASVPPRTRIVKKLIKKKRLVVSQQEVRSSGQPLPSEASVTNQTTAASAAAAATHTKTAKSVTATTAAPAASATTMRNSELPVRDSHLGATSSESHSCSTMMREPASHRVPSERTAHSSSSAAAAAANGTYMLSHGKELSNELRGIPRVDRLTAGNDTSNNDNYYNNNHHHIHNNNSSHSKNNNYRESTHNANAKHNPLHSASVHSNATDVTTDSSSTSHHEATDEIDPAESIGSHTRYNTVQNSNRSNTEDIRKQDGEAAAAAADDGRMDKHALPPPTVSSFATTADAATARGKKTPMIKAFRIDEILPACDASDAIFARRLPSGGCQFFAWPGTPLAVAAAAIVSMPDTIRTVHSVFGRTGVAIDLVLDIDCPVPQEYWSMSKIRPYQVRVLDEVLSVVHAKLAEIGERVASQVVLQSPNLKKASFHVHTKLVDAAFEDYSSLHGFLATMRDRVPNVDLQIYRPNGMLRMFSCMKENRTSAMTVFDEPRWNMGFEAEEGGLVPEAAAALHSLCIREAGSYSRLLHFDAPHVRAGGLYGDMHGDKDETTRGRGSQGLSGSGNAAGVDGRTMYGESINSHSSGGGSGLFDPNSSSRTGRPRRVPVLIPYTEREAVMNASRWLRQANEVEVGEWRSWIALGLCAFRIGHHFQNVAGLPRPAMEEMLDAWVEASRHCPQKFRHGDCQSRWATFDINKLKGDSDTKWWSAYQYIGRLTAPTQEALRREEGARNPHTWRRVKQETVDE